MKKLIGLWFVAVLLAACGRPAQNTPGEISELVAKGVQATLTAESVQQAIELGVQATLAASQFDSRAVAPAEIDGTAVPTRVPTATISAKPFSPTATRGRPSATPTIRPSVPPTATPTQEPQVVTTKAVNFRAGPGTNYSVVGAAGANKTYRVTGRNSDGSWFEICCYNDKPAWVAVSVVTFVGSAEEVKLAREIPPSPTAAPPTPTPAREINPPPDWVEYRQPDGLFAFYHPPTWQEGMPLSGGAQFGLGKPYYYFSVEVYREEKWRGKTDTQIQRAMIAQVQEIADISGNKATFTRQSRLPTSTRTNCILYTKGEGPAKRRHIEMIVILPGESTAVWVQGAAISIGGVDVPMTDDEAIMIASSFRKP